MQASTLHASMWSCITQIGHAPPLTSSSSAVVIASGCRQTVPNRKAPVSIGSPGINSAKSYLCTWDGRLWTTASRWFDSNPLGPSESGKHSSSRTCWWMSVYDSAMMHNLLGPSESAKCGSSRTCWWMPVHDSGMMYNPLSPSKSAKCGSSRTHWWMSVYDSGMMSNSGMVSNGGKFNCGKLGPEAFPLSMGMQYFQPVQCTSSSCLINWSIRSLISSL